MPSVVRIHHFPHKKSAERVVCISESIGKGKLLAVRFCGSSSVDRALAFQAKAPEMQLTRDANLFEERYCVARHSCETTDVLKSRIFIKS